MNEISPIGAARRHLRLPISRVVTRNRGVVAFVVLVGVLLLAGLLWFRSATALERNGPLKLAAQANGTSLLVTWDAQLAAGTELRIIVLDWDAYNAAIENPAFNVETFPYRVVREVSLVAGGGTETIPIPGWPPGEVLVTLQGPDAPGSTGSQLGISEDGSRYLWTATQVRVGP